MFVFLFQSDKKLAAMATFSSHRLIMGKDDIDNFSLGHLDFSIQKCLMSSRLRLYMTSPKR